VLLFLICKEISFHDDVNPELVAAIYRFMQDKCVYYSTVQHPPSGSSYCCLLDSNHMPHEARQVSSWRIKNYYLLSWITDKTIGYLSRTENVQVVLSCR